MKHFGSIVRSYTYLVLTYFALILLLPVDHVVAQKYMLDSVEYHALRFLLAIPLVIVWFAAFYAAAAVRDYAEKIKKTAEGPGFAMLARGCKWLAWRVSLPSVISLPLNTIGDNHPSLHPTIIIITNYLSLVLLLIAFSLISTATRSLSQQTKKPASLSSLRNLQLVFVTGGVFYCYLIFRYLNLHSLTSSHNPYFLPTWLLIITIIIPTLYAWFIGLLAAFDVRWTANQAPGLLYRRALQFLASGLVVVIACLVAIQYLTTVIPRTGHLSLGAALVVIYTIYLFAIAGFGLLAWGASRLLRIEEV
ncbi:MAG TPA: hypothetical protein VG604_01805 [Candidatus Saccharimonadales bacterium]|nr:hypothetical protein [Candidatus Saccharimonadales bacterium]